MPMHDQDILIVSAKRTPMGSFLGHCSSFRAPELAAVTHQAVLESAGFDPNNVDEVITGCVLSAGIGQAPARQAARLANIPDHVGATTLNKMCGSGMKAVMLAHDLIRAHSAQTVLAGGMESMSNAPYLLPKARQGYRLGHQSVIDHLLYDGLEDIYEPGKLMGCFADETAAHLDFSREKQDAYAKESMRRALEANEKGYFSQEIVPLLVQEKTGEKLIQHDEGPNPIKLTKLSKLKPSFTPNGTVTPGNSSSISDGASSLLIVSAAVAQQYHLKPMARIVGHQTHAQAPAWFTTAPIEAIRKLLKKINWEKNDVDLYEINEAFAVVTMAAIEALALDPTTVNVHGGACALGHPIGASGARIITTLLHALERYDKKRGIAALCIGGGEACAIAVERIV